MGGKYFGALIYPATGVSSFPSGKRLKTKLSYRHTFTCKIRLIHINFTLNQDDIASQLFIFFWYEDISRHYISARKQLKLSISEHLDICNLFSDFLDFSVRDVKQDIVDGCCDY